MDASKPFPCFMVRRDEAGKIHGGLESIRTCDLPAGDVLIEVAWSSLNYKDALACRGHPGVVSNLPHVPGIDCSGTVLESSAREYPPGMRVLVTGYGLGSAQWGGWSQQVRVPADWVVPIPEGLTEETAMVFGTAGFTAAQSVDALMRSGITPDSSEVVVTGATGGVGSISVAILAKLGFNVVAVSGKANRKSLLHSLGAKKIISRKEATDSTSRPLLASRWAGAIDTVGGEILGTIVRAMRHRGTVTTCGQVAGDRLPLTVYPFILRGVTLAGIDSAQCPRKQRLKLWRHLASDWRPDVPEQLVHKINLTETPGMVDQILTGSIAGRTLIRPTE
jgi:acrylyl-CoA reductase (NADPH)